MPLLRGGDEEEREDRSRVPEVEVPGVCVSSTSIFGFEHEFLSGFST